MVLMNVVLKLDGLELFFPGAFYGWGELFCLLI